MDNATGSNVMENEAIDVTRNDERGTALVMVLLILALLLTLVMASSLTAISESGVANTYGTQTIALQAAESGLNHAASLIMNYKGDNFTELLEDRYVIIDEDSGIEKFYFPIESSRFTTGAQMIVATNASGEPILADGGFLAATETTGFPLRDANNSIVPGASYSVRLIDDEVNPNSPYQDLRVPNFNPAAGYQETTGSFPNDATKDQNHRLVIYSTGKYANSSVTLEGWVAFLPYPALAANGSIQVTGNAEISGAYGGVHSNMNLSVGNSAEIEQSATAVGTATIANPNNVGGFSGGGQARLDIPEMVTTYDATTQQSPRLRTFLVQQANVLLVDPSFANGAFEIENQGSGEQDPTQRLKKLAESLNVTYNSLAAALDSDTNQGNKVQQTGAVAIEISRATNPGTATKISSPSDVGWNYGNNKWGILTNDNGLKAGGKTYYVVGRDNYNTANPASSTPNGGNVHLNGNVGSKDEPLKVTILATGSIEVNGTPNLKANLENLSTPLLPPFITINVLMVAVEDIVVQGDFDAKISFTGVSFAGEQVELSGNGSINGQVLSLGNMNVPNSPVNSNTNTVTGSFELTLNDGKSIGRISLYTWRQIKQ